MPLERALGGGTVAIASQSPASADERDHAQPHHPGAQSFELHHILPPLRPHPPLFVSALPGPPALTPPELQQRQSSSAKWAHAGSGPAPGRNPCKPSLFSGLNGLKN